jgi:hypothetical protein
MAAAAASCAAAALAARARCFASAFRCAFSAALAAAMAASSSASSCICRTPKLYALAAMLQDQPAQGCWDHLSTAMRWTALLWFRLLQAHLGAQLLLLFLPLDLPQRHHHMLLRHKPLAARRIPLRRAPAVSRQTPVLASDSLSMAGLLMLWYCIRISMSWGGMAVCMSVKLATETNINMNRVGTCCSGRCRLGTALRGRCPAGRRPGARRRCARRPSARCPAPGTCPAASSWRPRSPGGAPAQPAQHELLTLSPWGTWRPDLLQRPMRTTLSMLAWL